jgi:NitT/TauT family transport system substrate-binding protein
MKAPDDAIFVSLRTDYRKGIVSSMGPESEATAAKVFAILAEIGGEQLVGSSSTLAPNTFWANVGF